MEFLLSTRKIGSCFMCALSGQETGQCEAVLICDTLCPPGNGSPIMKVWIHVMFAVRTLP